MNYTSNRALFTDLYQLTMSQGYYELNLNQEATFELFFRKNPFEGGFTVVSGLLPALEYLTNFKFDEEEIKYLEDQKLFSDGFLDFLHNVKFTGNVTGVKEGTILFPYTPILSVTAPLIEAQLVETALLNIINYSSLISTKAARICNIARGGNVVDFGTRRAQGDSVFLGVRSALIGGCSGTSFVQGGKIFGCPISGTQAHSWVQAFDSELEAFKAYAKIFPDSCLLLIDTYDVLHSGVPNAITIAKDLKKINKKLIGVRIDSGDLGYLATEVYRHFKKAGFPDIKIVLSNELDEYTINSIVNQILGNPDLSSEEKSLRKSVVEHLVYGVGTRLITGGNQSALGGVYKLVSLNGKPRIKISENVAKTINPSRKDLWRIVDIDNNFLVDILGIKGEEQPKSGDLIHHPIERYKNYKLPKQIKVENLHQPLMKKGKVVIDESAFNWKNAQKTCKNQLRSIDYTYRRLLNPHIYKVSLSQKLHNLKIDMIKRNSF